MAPTQKKPVTPNFKDVDKEAVERARGAVQGGKTDPLTPPEDAKVSEDKKGRVYIRWNEQVVITAAYRTVTKKGLLDIVLAHKIRQSEENNGKTFFAHFYMNTSDEINEGHESMNDRTNGAIITLLEAIVDSKGKSLMPPSGQLSGRLLAQLFPEKGKPGDAPSVLVNKSVIANVVQQHEPATDPKTGKPKKTKDGEVAIQKRDSAESYLPDVAADEEE
jgi:hypothetical protein